MKLKDNSPEYWEFIRQVRFHPDNVKGFVDREPVTREQQERYMKAHGHKYKVCVMDGEPVGFIGVVDGDIRLAVHPDHKKKGIGEYMLKNVNMPHTAKVLRSNLPSLRLFLKCGYEVKNQDYIFYYL